VDGIGVVLAIAFSLLYPLVIWFLVRKFRFAEEPYRILFAAFLLGAVVFYLAYLRKIYILFLGGMALYGVDLIATGFIEEAVKLLVLIIPFIRTKIGEGNGAFYGLVVGLGFGGGEAILVLGSAAAYFFLNQLALTIDLILLDIFLTMTMTGIEGLLMGLLILPQLISEISILMSVVFGPSLFGLPLISVYERMMAVLFHASTAAIIGYGLVRGKTLKYFLIAVFLHIILDTFAVLYAVGLMSILATEIIIGIVALVVFVYAMYTKVLNKG
jgi:hypothetical protein